MNLKNIAYASALSTVLGCTALPDLKHPEVRMQLEGTYKGVLDGNKVTYKVGKEACVALVDFGLQISHIIDYNCDNVADFVNLQNRKYLLESGKAEDADEVLEYIQQELVKPKYKVK